jgi:GT2 family glycosyltransferase
MSKIFVQIASYRDLQLIPTIEDMLKKAKYPNNLTFGICWQYDDSENIQYFDEYPNFRIKKYKYYESEGLGWARAETNNLYNGEYYTLQIDSHHRFVKNWDAILLEDFNQALKYSKKPIITTYCTPFNPEEDEEYYNTVPCLMSQYEFSADKLLMSMPYFIQDYRERDTIIRARTISGHFLFTLGKFIEEVPYDPDIYFGGYTEETTMSLRAFTHGYDFFSPYRMVMWHEYTRSYRPKHWEDHEKESRTEKSSTDRDIFSRLKTRQLFEQEENGIHIDKKYGLGSERTLHDYEVYAGFDFKRCLIQEYTLKVNEPPNPLPWEEKFNYVEYYLECVWDLDFFKSLNFDNPILLTLGIYDSNNQEIYRKDFTEKEYLELEKNYFDLDIKLFTNPNKIVMYLLDKEKGWSPMYEKYFI